MGINKVQINKNGKIETLIDLTNNTVTEDTMLKGVKGHGADGEEVVGTIETFDGGYECSGESTGGEITLQDKEITENGTYTADDGFDGFGTVNVNVTSSGDGNLDALIDGSITNIKSNVTKIPQYKFYFHNMLQEADFPTVTDIGHYAFEGCVKLLKINLPLVRNLGTATFKDSGINVVKFPMLEEVSADCFISCDKLSFVALPKVTFISERAFSGCYSLTYVSCPEVEDISERAFERCESLSTINFPKLKSIGKKAFAECHALENIDFKSVEFISEGCFMDCTKLKTVKLTNVSTIYKDTFLNCSSLHTLDCSATLLTTNALIGCTSLKNLVLRSSKKMVSFNGSVSDLAQTKIMQGQGFVYVAQALKETYKVAFEQLMTGGSYLIRAIEDYTVDGTLTGELDESRI